VATELTIVLASPSILKVTETTKIWLLPAVAVWGQARLVDAEAVLAVLVPVLVICACASEPTKTSRKRRKMRFRKYRYTAKTLSGVVGPVPGLKP
jgi:hypothetical protein